MKCKAEFLYRSPLFIGNLRYAKSLRPDLILILSAEYGLLELDRIVDPYDKTLNSMSSTEVKEWADKVIADLCMRTDLKRDHYIFLAGDRYRKFLVTHLSSYEIPLRGMPIGKQLHFLNSVK
jgi:hypothetical protein